MRQDVFDLISLDHQRLARLCEKVLHADAKRRAHAFAQLDRAFASYAAAVDAVLYEALHRAHPDVVAGVARVLDATRETLDAGELRDALAEHAAWCDELLVPKALRLIPDGHAEAFDYRSAKAEAERAIDEGGGARHV
jgi:hypothetical protein